MLTVQPFTWINLSTVFSDIVDIDCVFLLFEITRKHFFAGFVEFTFLVFREEVDADAFCVKFTMVSALLKTGV